MPGNISIRMYNVGFGDCFLVTLPTRGGDRKILVDCGSIKKKEKSIEDIAKQVIEDVTVNGKARIDVLVLSHRHDDHLSGFAKKVWGEVEVGEVWMPWVESLTDPAARRIRNELAATARNLRTAATLLGLDEDRIGAVALNALSDEGALGTLHRGFKGEPERRFFPKSKTVVVEKIETPLLPGIDIFVMGPPHNDKALNDPDPPQGQSLLTGFSANPDGATAGEKFQPFGEGWIEEYPPFLDDQQQINEAASMIAAYELAAAKLDADINNTSLILLFRIGDEYLLFPGDAQWGPWELALGDAEAMELLEKVTFLKVSHHSSHNGTPASLLRDIIGKNNAHNGVVQAMVSMTPKKGWEGIPHEPILTLLTERNFPFCVSDRTEGNPPAPFVRNGSLCYDLDIPATGAPSTPVELAPAVPIRRSVSEDHIVCLEDGKKLKMLKRHLMTEHGLTPEAYRAKWGLRQDYPMVAPNYSLQRQALAKQIGLGRKPAPPPPAPEPKPKRRRKPAA